MENIQSIEDIKHTFFILFVNNRSSSPLTIKIHGHNDCRPIIGGCHSEDGPIYSHESCDSDAGEKCYKYIYPYQNFYLILDLRDKIKKIKFPLRLAMAACRKFNDGINIPNGYRYTSARVECLIKKEFNRKTIDLDYDNESIQINGKNIYERTDVH